jgi:2-iminobutanoate/2-iminopropanoate deaminase
MTRRTLTASLAPQPAGPYSHAAIGGGIVAVAGQIGVDPATGELVRGGVGAQMRQALANIEAILHEAGSSLRSVLRIGVFLADLDDFAELNDVCRELLPEPFPARTTVAVGLPEGVLVEIDALSVVTN